MQLTRKVSLLIFLCISCISSYAQIDSTAVARIVEGTGMIAPRYKMYKTEHNFILIKLDTATGALWLVQFGLSSNAGAFETEIDSTSLLKSWMDERPGRYELYATNNMYNFILLDTEFGYTYQVQWHPEASKRFRERIY